MTTKADLTGKKQGRRGPNLADAEQLRQLLFPMVVGIAATRSELGAFVQRAGLTALEAILRDDAEAIAGPKGRHQAERTHHHWGTTRTELPLGGRRVAVTRPRVRRRNGREEVLPTLARLRGTDPLPDRVVDQILAGVSTRSYERSLEPTPPDVQARGASKSAASRHIVTKTAAKVKEYMNRPLDELKLVALLLDGINIGDHTIVVALGVGHDGTKTPLGLWLGSTENARVCTELLGNLTSRGLKVEDRILCVIDGGKGIRKALVDVFGSLALIQRCQVHKTRNVRDHLSKGRQLRVGRLMNDAYRSAKADTARRRLRSLVSWLDNNGEEGAAASLREGLEETLTVMKLGLPSTLARSFSTTNAIENMLGTVRRVTRNVKRWSGGDMARRWTALGVLHAKESFRRIKGHKDLPVLVRALATTTVDRGEIAA
jgi:transposase-like protein